MNLGYLYGLPTKGRHKMQTLKVIGALQVAQMALTEYFSVVSLPT